MSGPYDDPRLVELYDEDNPAGPDHDFFRGMAEDLDARSVVDLGCGTGLLTVTLAAPDRAVTGVDPSAAMLDVARHRPGTEQVHWVQGDASVLAAAVPAGSADLVLMSGNAAQHVPPADWSDTLAAAHDVLRPGGMLAFDSRDPDARAWAAWTPQATRSDRQIRHGMLTEWLDAGSDGPRVEDGALIVRAHNRFERTGEVVVLDLLLVFRSPEQLRVDLGEAGFTDVTVAVGWPGTLVVTARRAAGAA